MHVRDDVGIMGIAGLADPADHGAARHPVAPAHVEMRQMRVARVMSVRVAYLDIVAVASIKAGHRDPPALGCDHGLSDSCDQVYALMPAPAVA